MIPTGKSSPYLNYDINYAYRVDSDGNVDGIGYWGVSGSYGIYPSPGPEYVSYSSCQVESSGNVGSYGTVVGDSYGIAYAPRKYPSFALRAHIIMMMRPVRILLMSLVVLMPNI